MTVFENMVVDNVKAESFALDLGCGDGKHGPFANREFQGKMRVGLDNDKKLLIENKELKYPVLGDAHYLPFIDSTFDIVFMREVIEHVQNPEIIFSEISRTMQSGGYLIMKTPNKRNPISYLSSIVSVETKACLKKLFTNEEYIEGNYRVYYKCNTGKKLTKALERNGFEVERIVYVNIGLNWVKSPFLRIALHIYQKIASLKRFEGFRQQVICLARKK